MFNNDYIVLKITNIVKEITTMKKISDYLNSVKMTILSGVFLALSLALLITKNFVELSISPYLDPAWITIVISGFPLLYLAISRLVKRKWISSALLITVAMIASIIVGEVFAAGEVAFIMAIGSILEDKTVEKAKKGLNKLISLKPTTANLLLSDGITTKEINVDYVKIGQKIRIFPGEIIPLDGKIVSGNTSVNQAVMTGESLPVDKTVNDLVYCGTTNLNGSIDIEITTLSSNSSLEKMIKLIEEAETKKAPSERIADKWATWLVPVAIAIAIIVGIVTNFTIGNENNIALIRAVTILVVFCPCALALATPTSVMAGIGQATKHGIIIKSGQVIEEMGKINCITFDKTGTLTEGKLQVSDVISFSNLSIERIIELAASLENKSEHPLAKAIVKKASLSSILNVDNFIAIPGKGIKGTIDIDYLIGNERFLKENNIILSKEQLVKVDLLRKEGKALIFLASKNELLGVIGLSDTLRKEAISMVTKLKDLNIEVVLLTGDNKLTAEYFAKMVGINKVYSDLLPEDKVSKIIELQNEGYKVSHIGDGVNDAPSFKIANVGISMGGIGSDIAVDASGITLMNDNIENIPYLCVLAKSTFRTIKFNITMSMVINFVAILLSSFGLLNPITGALVHNVGSVLVVLNAALVYNRDYIKKTSNRNN